MDTIRSGFVEAARVLEQFTNDRTAWEALEQAGRLMVETLRGGGKIITCGNGGSMCDAMHFAEELTGRFRGNRRALAAVALCDPTHITCVANDYGYDYIFSKGVEAVGRPGDLLLGITTSGNSRNVLEAVACGPFDRHEGSRPDRQRRRTNSVGMRRGNPRAEERIFRPGPGDSMRR